MYSVVTAVDVSVVVLPACVEKIEKTIILIFY